jgi:ADP-ribose pyrophosphatase
MGFRMLAQRTRARGRVLEWVDQEWRDPDGATFRRTTILHPGAVAMVPCLGTQRVLLVRQFRAAAGRWLLEIPAGTREPGEPPLRCAQRELREEVGHRARRWRKLGAIFPAPGFCTEVIHLYQALDLVPAKGQLDEDEHLEVVSMTWPQVRAAVRSGAICDGKTLSALLLLG